MRLPVRVLILLLVSLAAYAAWAWPNRPVDLEPLPGGRLPSVSFAPFRDGQSPLTEVFATRGQIEADLRLLAPEVRGVRTYTSREGLEAVPPIARELGLEVMQGAWIDSEPEINEAEIEALIRSAREYPDVVRRVIVGNEVLLRGTRTPAQLAELIGRVRAAIDQPVGYADVWEFWLRHPQMAEHVDFIVIHILPYWEDDPVSVDGAERRILEAHAAIRERFPGKPVVIGEIGWPTAGRTRGPAETGLVEKARFINMVVRLAEREGFDYNLIEAFDQSWKSLNEGTVGANWGLFSADRERKFSLSGPVVADPLWRRHAAAAIVLALAGTALAVRRRPLGAAGFLATAALAQGLAGGLVWAVHVAASETYYPFETMRAWALVAVHAVAAASILRAFAEALGGGRPGGEGRPGDEGRLGRPGGTAVVLLTLTAMAQTALLVVDGRYRDFLVPDLAGPAVGLLLLGLVRVDRGEAMPFAVIPVPPRAGRAAAVLLVLGAAAIVLSEGWVNREAVTWAVLLAVLAVPWAAVAVQSRNRSGRSAAPGATA
jgi:exo-beta-1,3-glucanase (GH17 family)